MPPRPKVEKHKFEGFENTKIEPEEGTAKRNKHMGQHECGPCYHKKFRKGKRVPLVASRQKRNAWVV